MSTAKSVVLSCAGIGSRLGLGLTKALIDIDGRSLIGWQLELLSKVDDLRVVIGFQAQDVVNEVLKYRKDVIFIYNHNYFETKTGASFYLGAKDANEYVIAWDGDLLVHPDDVEKCLEYKGEYIGYSSINSTEAVFVRTNQDGDILEFSVKSGNFEWTGPACLRKDRLKFTNGNVYNQIEPYLPMKGLQIRAQDVDTYEDYQKIIKFVRSWS